MDAARIKKFRISSEFISRLFATGNVIQAVKVVSGLPKDAFVCRIIPDQSYDAWFIVVHSADFPAIREGDAIPDGEITVSELIQ